MIYVPLADLIHLAKVDGSYLAHAAIRAYTRMVRANPNGTIRTIFSDGNYYTIIEPRPAVFTWHDNCPREPAPMSVQSVYAH